MLVHNMLMLNKFHYSSTVLLSTCQLQCYYNRGCTLDQTVPTTTTHISYNNNAVRWVKLSSYGNGLGSLPLFAGVRDIATSHHQGTHQLMVVGVRWIVAI